VKDLLLLLELIVKMHQPLVIVAEDIEQDALATLVVTGFGAFCLVSR
jgi:chaperonin GroEL (HSP60 family)